MIDFDWSIALNIVAPALILAGVFGAVAICIECTRDEGGF